jgi:hypothetical protein
MEPLELSSANLLDQFGPPAERLGSGAISRGSASDPEATRRHGRGCREGKGWLSRSSS